MNSSVKSPNSQESSDLQTLAAPPTPLHPNPAGQRQTLQATGPMSSVLDGLVKATAIASSMSSTYARLRLTCRAARILACTTPRRLSRPICTHILYPLAHLHASTQVLGRMGRVQLRRWQPWHPQRCRLPRPCADQHVLDSRSCSWTAEPDELSMQTEVQRIRESGNVQRHVWCDDSLTLAHWPQVARTSASASQAANADYRSSDARSFCSTDRFHCPVLSSCGRHRLVASG